MIELLALAARTVTGQQEITTPADLDLVESASILLDVTAAATGVGDTLNVRIQGLYDLPDGTIRFADDFISFTQLLGNGGAKQIIAQWRRDTLPESEVHAAAADALAAGVLQGPVPKRWRASWIVAGAGPPSFSFRLLGALVYRGR